MLHSIHQAIQANAMPDAPPNPDMLHMAAMGRHHAIKRNTVDAFHTAYASLELEYKKKYRELRADGTPIKWVMPVTCRGYTVHCGYIPVNGRNVLAVHRIDADTVYNLRAEIAKRPDDIKPDADRGVPDLRDVPLIPDLPKKDDRPIDTSPPAEEQAVLPPAPIPPVETRAVAASTSPLLLAGDMAEALGLGKNGSRLRSVYGALEQAYRAEVMLSGKPEAPFSAMLPIRLNDHTVRCGYVSRGNTRLYFGVHQDDQDALAAIREIRAADPVGQRRQRQKGVIGPYTGAVTEERTSAVTPFMKPRGGEGRG